MVCNECGYEEDIVISFSHEWESKVSELTMICVDCDPDAEVVETILTEEELKQNELLRKMYLGERL